MAVFQLPITNHSAHYEFKTTLSEVNYLFTFRYNHRTEKWYMSIADGDSNPIVYSIPIYLDVNLTSQFTHLDLPFGMFICLNLRDEKEDPTRDSFGDSVRLYFNDLES